MDAEQQRLEKIRLARQKLSKFRGRPVGEIPSSGVGVTSNDASGGLNGHPPTMTTDFSSPYIQTSRASFGNESLEPVHDPGYARPTNGLPPPPPGALPPQAYGGLTTTTRARTSDASAPAPHSEANSVALASPASSYGPPMSLPPTTNSYYSQYSQPEEEAPRSQGSPKERDGPSLGGWMTSFIRRAAGTPNGPSQQTHEFNEQMRQQQIRDSITSVNNSGSVTQPPPPPQDSGFTVADESDLLVDDADFSEPIPLHSFSDAPGFQQIPNGSAASSFVNGSYGDFQNNESSAWTEASLQSPEPTVAQFSKRAINPLPTSDLEQSLQSAQNQIEEERNKRVAVETQISTLTSKWQGALEKMLKERESMTARLTAAETERDQVQQKLQEEIAHRAEHAPDATSTGDSQELEARNADIQALKEQIRLREAEVDQCTKSLFEREIELEQERTAIQNERGSFQQQRDIYENVNSECTAARAELERTRQELAAVQASRATNEDAANAVQSIQKNLDDTRQELTARQGALDSLQRDNESLKARLTAAETEREQIRQELLEDSARKDASWEEQVRSREAQIDQQRRMLSERESEIERERSEISQERTVFQQEISAARQARSEIEENMGSELQRTRQELAALQEWHAKNEGAAVMLTKVQQELDVTRRELSTLQASVADDADAVIRNEQARADAEQAARERIAADSLRRQVEVERAKLAVDRAGIDADRAKVAADRATFSDREAKLQRMAEEVEHKQSVLNDERRRFDDMRSRVEESQKQFEVDRKNLEASRATLAEREAKHRALLDDALAKQAAVREETSRAETLKRQVEKDLAQLERDRQSLLERETQLQKRTTELLAGQGAATEETKRVTEMRRQCDSDRKLIESERAALVDREMRHKAAVEEFTRQRQATMEESLQVAEKSRQLQAEKVTLAERQTLANKALEDHAAKQRELDAAIRTFNEFKAQLDTATQQREASLQGEKRELESERDRVQNQLATERAEMEARMNAERANVDDAMRLVELDRAAVGRREDAARKALDEVESKRIAISEELNVLDLEKSKLSVLKAQIEQGKLEMQARERGIVTKEKEVTQTLSEAERLKNGLSGQTAEATERVRSLESTVSQLMTERDSLRDRLAAALSTHEVAVRQMSLQDSGVQTYKDRISDLERENRSYQANVLRLTDMLEAERRRDGQHAGNLAGSSFHHQHRSPSIAPSAAPSVYNSGVDERVQHLEHELEKLRAAVAVNSNNGKSRDFYLPSETSQMVNPSVHPTDAASQIEGKTTSDLLNVIVALTSTNQTLSHKIEELGQTGRRGSFGSGNLGILSHKIDDLGQTGRRGSFGTGNVGILSPPPGQYHHGRSPRPHIPDLTRTQDHHQMGYSGGYGRVDAHYGHQVSHHSSPSGRDRHHTEDLPSRTQSPYLSGRSPRHGAQEGYVTDYDADSGASARRGRALPSSNKQNGYATDGGDRKVSIASTARSELHWDNQPRRSSGGKPDGRPSLGQRGPSMHDVQRGPSLQDVQRSPSTHDIQRGPSTHEVPRRSIGERDQPRPYNSVRRLSNGSDRSEAVSHTSAYSTTAAATAAAARTAALRAKLEAAKARMAESFSNASGTVTPSIMSHSNSYRDALPDMPPPIPLPASLLAPAPAPAPRRTSPTGRPPRHPGNSPNTSPN
ncbi:hypothetical protein DFS34DRAFT_686437 [Phlyctochytrium arcticum]|nr:hypothetical protein DFS34DRAFT_686437 [Phlyctochytrium arcticum]